MFSGQLIAISFIGMFVAIGVFLIAENQRWPTAKAVSAIVGLSAAVYCIASGLHLLVGWQDPLSGASSQELARASARHGGKGGIFILAIRFWPYVLIGLGGYFGFGYIVILKRVVSRETLA